MWRIAELHIKNLRGRGLQLRGEWARMRDSRWRRLNHRRWEQEGKMYRVTTLGTGLLDRVELKGNF